MFSPHPDRSPAGRGQVLRLNVQQASGQARQVLLHVAGAQGAARPSLEYRLKNKSSCGFNMLTFTFTIHIKNGQRGPVEWVEWLKSKFVLSFYVLFTLSSSFVNKISG